MESGMKGRAMMRLQQSLWVLKGVLGGVMLLGSLLGVPLAEAATYYVATSGNDANPGTESAPFATILRAQQAVGELAGRGLTEDVTIHVHDGTYFLDAPLRFGPADAGTTEFSVTYSAAEGASPIISGGRIVAQGTFAELSRQLLGEAIYELRLAPSHPAAQLPPLLDGLATVEELTEDGLCYRCAEPHLVNPQILARLAAGGLPVVALAEVPRSLEDVYPRIVGEGAEREQGTGSEQGTGDRGQGNALLSRRPAL